MNLLDFIFPKRCVSCGRIGFYICKDCYSKIEFIDKPICPVCQRQAIGGKTHPGCTGKYQLDGLVIACRYKGPVKLAIVKLKYRWVSDIVTILSKLIVDNIWRFNLPDNVIITFVPLHKKRSKWRGFNQSHILVRQLSKKYKIKFQDVLVREAETLPQVNLSKNQRRSNVKDAFIVKDNVVGENLVLVDDVYTSGATMQACARVLKKSGAKSVWGMAVALG